MPTESGFHVLEVPVQGQPGPQSIDYLPFGTRTLKLRVTAEDPDALRGQRLILRSEHLPKSFGRRRLYSHEDGTTHFRVSWGGGRNRTGACLSSADVMVLNHKVPLQECREIGWQPSYVYLNVTHSNGPFDVPYHLLLGIHREGAPQHEPPVQVIPVTLTPPQQVSDGLVKQPFRYNPRTGSFVGAHVPGYLGRWWSPWQVRYVELASVPSLHIAHYENILAVEGRSAPEDHAGGRPRIAEIADHIGFQGVVGDTRLFDAELYHLHGDYFVLRLWFSWLMEHGIRTGLDEIPDAERFDLVIDAVANQVVFAATDFHWREVWVRACADAHAPVRGHLGLMSESGLQYVKDKLPVLDSARESWLACVEEVLQQDNWSSGLRVPSETVCTELRGPGQVTSRGLGLEAHVPSLENCLPPDGLDFVSSDPNWG